jgi:formylglycine-generating enzyme required for sulfatase activity
MAGNVWEWVADAYDSEYYERSPARNPTGPEDEQIASSKVVRGGSWSDANVRASSRLSLNPDGQFDLIGFRCALSVPD